MRRPPDWAAHFLLYLGTGAMIFAMVYLLSLSCSGGHR